MVLLGSVLAAIGCAEAPTDSNGNTAGAGYAGTGVPTAGTWASTAGTGGSVAGTGGGVAGTGSVAVGRSALGSTPMPCDVTATIKLRCQSCHAATPISGVPMALMSWEDFDAPSTSNPAMKVRDLVKARVHDVANPMPPTGIMPSDELAMVDAWIDSGGLAGTDLSCAPVIDDPDAGPGYDGEIPPYADNCYELRVHANGDKNAPLMVNGENYGWFYFDAPWPDNAQAVHIETIPGDHPEVLHHWLLYAETQGNQPDGKVEYPVLAGFHPSAPTLLAGWAPGADKTIPPDHVGMQLHGPNKKMSLEFHFYGQGGSPKAVNAGVKVCTVEKPERLRPNKATVSWLGTELNINIPPYAQDSKATGTCIPQWPAGVEEIHILRSWPHMHLKGRKMTSTIIRADGTRENMHTGDGWPFDFNNEVSHKTEFVLKKGDKVETTCHYTNDTGAAIQVGFENRYEMCFNFVTAYPANALVNTGGLGATPSFTGTSTGCLSNGPL